jgi:hypothetical protein
MLRQKPFIQFYGILNLLIFDDFFEFFLEIRQQPATFQLRFIIFLLLKVFFIIIYILSSFGIASEIKSRRHHDFCLPRFSLFSRLRIGNRWFLLSKTYSLLCHAQPLVRQYLAPRQRLKVVGSLSLLPILYLRLLV